MEVKKLWKFLEDMPFSKIKWLVFKKGIHFICENHNCDSSKITYGSDTDIPPPSKIDIGAGIW
jgi:hypothetical protein